MAKRQKRRRRERRRGHANRGGLQTHHSVITGVGLAAGAALGVAAPAATGDGQRLRAIRRRLGRTS